MTATGTLERFWSKVDRGADDECWTWKGTILNVGYGQFAVWRGEKVGAHRFAYELMVGPIPDGLHIDHLCRNRFCVNPSHMEPVTPRENVIRGDGPSAQNARRTHCVNGHEFSLENTGRTDTGRRYCRACKRDHARRRRSDPTFNVLRPSRAKAAIAAQAARARAQRTYQWRGHVCGS